MKSYRKEKITYHFKKPLRISPAIQDQIRQLIERGGAVGLSYVRENLQNAFLIGFAINQQGRVVGTVTLKNPKKNYRKKIEAATGLDLSGYLERGYTSIDPDFGNLDIADHLIKGLIARSKGHKTYVTIRMDHLPALKITYNNGMLLAAEFTTERTGNRIGVFTNQAIGGV